jgi:predicted HTH transcriptional regulator
LGITPDDLSREHDSIQRNPIIAEVFYRAGLIEKWGRGTNRVIAQCREAGIAPPEFREVAGSTVVTFRVQVGLTPHVTPQVTPQVTPKSSLFSRLLGNPILVKSYNASLD